MKASNVEEMDFIDFKCPYCGKVASFLSELEGKMQDCPECRETLIVPAPGSEYGVRLPIPFPTSRLRLRRLKVDDSSDLLPVWGDEEICRYLIGEPMEEEGIIQWLRSDAMKSLTHPGHSLTLGVELKSDGKLIGTCSIDCADKELVQATLSVCINRSFQRQGYGTEAMQGLMGLCLEGLRLHRVITICDIRNKAARRVFEKAGLRHEGEGRQDVYSKGEWIDSIYYALLNAEYLARKSPVAAR